MDDRADDPACAGLDIDVVPLERQDLFGPKTGALRHHHRAIGLGNQREDLVVLLDGKNDRFLAAFADALDFD